MALAEAEKRTPEKPQKIVTNNCRFEIIIPQKNKIVFVNVLDDDTVEVWSESLSKKEERVTMKEKFMEVTRHLICSNLGVEAAELTKAGEEAIKTDASFLKAEFDDGVNYLLGLNFSDKEVQSLVKESASQISFGQQHIGELSPPVREQVVELKNRVEEIYNEKAQRARETRS